MAIPAVNIWLSVWIPARNVSDQPLIIQTLPINFHSAAISFAGLI